MLLTVCSYSLVGIGGVGGLNPVDLSKMLAGICQVMTLAVLFLAYLNRGGERGDDGGLGRGGVVVGDGAQDVAVAALCVDAVHRVERLPEERQIAAREAVLVQRRVQRDGDDCACDRSERTCDGDPEDLMRRRA